MAACGALALAGPVTANAATAVHPAGGSGFTGGAEGWSGSGATCAPASGLEILCTTTASYSDTEGNPAGSITSRIDVLVNGGGLLQGETTWTSPDFTIALGSPTRAAAVALDRRLDAAGLVALDPESTYVVSLVDRTDGDEATTLLSETIDATASAFARRAAAVPDGMLVEGHTYALTITTNITTRTARAGVAGSLDARYDNISVTASDRAPGAGLQPIGDGASGTPGVTVTGPPLSNTALRDFLRTFSFFAEVGNGPGGSVVDIARCTILGTPGKDRIKGTPGNDVICGLGGKDRISGGRGHDVIDTGDGNDVAGGGAGRDTLVGVRGKDRLGGAGGKDRLGGGALGDRLTGGKGNDLVRGGSGRDRLTGSRGKDRLLAGAGRDRIRARDRARDRVNGGPGRDFARVDRRRTGGKSGARRKLDVVRRVERAR
jgi:Ca2+-binding RTX toxin-like protein